jgi:cupin 2 domain-containing protein
MNKNFFSLPECLHTNEFIENILESDSLRIERIISTGQATPSGKWYDQEWDEWVILLSGSAGIFFEGDDEISELNPGDFLNIPAHKRHRVEWTDHNETTFWLAVHFNNTNIEKTKI